MTRARSAVVHEHGRVIQRLEKFLENTGIKLSATVSHLTGASSRAMLEALVGGQRDPAVLASLARGRLKAKIPDLTEALVGRFNDHDAFMVSLYLNQLDEHQKVIDTLTAKIGEAIEPFHAARDFLATIPGVSETVADVIIAETGADMNVFATPARLAAWTGVCPGSNESAGRSKSSRTRPGNNYLKAALGIAALGVAHTKNTYLNVKYRRITAHRGKMKAIVAIEHAILTAAWHLLAEGVCYQDPGADYYLHRDPPARSTTHSTDSTPSATPSH